ncbi:MAG: phosphate signaling complex protein PhoU [Proteobacteria bacterium]|nr:phosphate signaling complex protein PhoU [Pseudomonadota bacterium]
MLEEKITALRKELIEYAAIIEGMIEGSVNAQLRKDSAVLMEIIEKDEPIANDVEITIEDMCIGMIAQFQPKAKDLRTILMILKINNDLERAGDHAVNIAESGLFLNDRPQLKPLIDIPRMAQDSINMLKDSITSFINEDSPLAYNVCERDNEVDELGNQILRELITYMTCDPSTIERSLQLLKIARNLERIADLSTNICEDVIFMVDGAIIKHHILDKNILV